MNDDEYHCKAHNVEKIIEDYLRDNGFDGLYYEIECGCEITNLMPCSGSGLDCTPGYKIPTPEDHELYGETDWIIGPKPDTPPRGEKETK